MWLEITPNPHKLGDMAVKAKALSCGAKKGRACENRKSKKGFALSG